MNLPIMYIRFYRIKRQAKKLDILIGMIMQLKT
jgi:hypothetical protein